MAYNPYAPMNGYGGGYVPNPYVQRYEQAMQQMNQPMQPAVQVTQVNGRNGAEAFQLPPNSSTLLLDSTAPIVWLVQSDGAGYKTCTPYSITPYQAQPEPDFQSLNERLTRLEERVNESHAANVKPAERRSSAGTDTNVGTK